MPKLDDELPSNPPALLRGLRDGENAPPSRIYARDPRRGLCARHPEAPPGFPTANAAHHYVANHSAGTAGLHWTVVWARYVPATEARLVSYCYLLFHMRFLRPLYDAIADLRAWAALACWWRASHTGPFFFSCCAQRSLHVLYTVAE